MDMKSRMMPKTQDNKKDKLQVLLDSQDIDSDDDAEERDKKFEKHASKLGIRLQDSTSRHISQKHRIQEESEDDDSEDDILNSLKEEAIDGFDLDLQSTGAKSYCLNHLRFMKKKEDDSFDK